MSQPQRGTDLLSRQAEGQGNGGGVGKPSCASTPDLPAAALSLHLHQAALAEQRSSVTAPVLPGDCRAQPSDTSLCDTTQETRALTFPVSIQTK